MVRRLAALPLSFEASFTAFLRRHHSPLPPPPPTPPSPPPPPPPSPPPPPLLRASQVRRLLAQHHHAARPRGRGLLGRLPMRSSSPLDQRSSAQSQPLPLTPSGSGAMIGAGLPLRHRGRPDRARRRRRRPPRRRGLAPRPLQGARARLPPTRRAAAARHPRLLRDGPRARRVGRARLAHRAAAGRGGLREAVRNGAHIHLGRVRRAGRGRKV